MFSFRKYFSLVVFLVLASLFVGCFPTIGTESGNSADLSDIFIEGAPASLGIPNAVLGEETAGFVFLSEDSGGPTEAIPVSSGAVRTKVTKFTANEDALYASGFSTKDAYNNEQIDNGDFFVVLSTGSNGSQLYYRIKVRRGESYFMYDLRDSNVNNETAYENVRFFVSDISMNLADYNAETTYESIAADFGNPVSTLLDTFAGRYLYAFEFSDAESGTLLIKSGVSSLLSGTDSDESVAVNLSAVSPPPPPSYDPDNPVPEEPIPYANLEDYMDTIPPDVAANPADPLTIKVGAVSLSNSASPLGGFTGWGEIDTLISSQAKYIVLDLSACSFDANKIVGNASPSGNDMNIIQGNTYIKGIVLPSTLETIFDSAFAGCINLSSIVIPPSVNFIESRAFFGCTGLASIDIPEGVEIIGTSAFDNCGGLTSVSLPSSVTTIGENAFPEGASGSGGNILRTQFESNGAGAYERSAGDSDWHKVS